MLRGVRHIRCGVMLGGALLAMAAGASPAAARSAVQVPVMSYNVFQGSELSNSLAATSIPLLASGAAKDYANVISSNLPARATALAGEIAANRPALVGLQEAVLWRTAPSGAAPVALPGKATHVSYDSVKLIVKALAARGLHYRAAAIVNNFDVQVTAAFAGGRKLDIRITDRVAILARSDVRISNAQTHNYVAHDVVSFLGFPIAVSDGWASVDAKLGGRTLRFITTHLAGANDASAPGVRAAEAAEIVAGPAKTALPVVFTCDCNATTATPTYSELTAAGLRDAWALTHPTLPGLTCCHRAHPGDAEVDLTNTSPTRGIVERIDYVFASLPFAVRGEKVVGLSKADRTRTRPPLWPSDHLGLAAQLTLP